MTAAVWKFIENNWRIIAVAGLIMLLVITAKIARSNLERAVAAEHELKLSNATIADMQTRQREVADLDEKYTKELADAKATIESLRDDVATGKRRLQLNATCKGNTSGPARVDDATAPGLTNSAERDYFTLRERIETSGKMIAGLQQYIREQCLK